MTSIVKLTALSGAQNESPLCYLLQVDEFRFLLDCGWDENFDREILANLQRHVKQIDAVLLSYPDILHLGALPYLVGKMELKCPIYATTPVYKMGEMFMYDLYQSRYHEEDFNLFSLDDIDQAFDQVIQLKYSQNVALKGKGNGLTITPYAAGHMVGGTMWKIVKDGEEDILYAVDYNHKKERHLDGAVLESLGRPSLLITDAFNALNVPAKRKKRDEALITEILRTMERGGNMLIAVDTAARVLELSQLLDQLWPNEDLSRYNIVLLNYQSWNVINFAKSQVEWMSEKILKLYEDRQEEKRTNPYEDKRDNPFKFRYIRSYHSIEELDRIPDPKVVLASPPDLECGLARELFLRWAGDQKNSVIFTTRTSPGTLARILIDNPRKESVVLEVRRRVRLQGAELDAHTASQAEKESALKLEREQLTSVSASRGIASTLNLSLSVPEVDEDSDSDMDTDLEPTSPIGQPAKQLKTPRHDLMLSEETKSRSTFFKQTKSFPMFISYEHKPKCDDYGEIIRAEDYMRDPYYDRLEDNVFGSGIGSKVTEAQKREKAPAEHPTKCISTMQYIDIKCTITFIDFEGRSDGDSIKRILSLVKPRQLIIVHGMPEPTAHLAEYCIRNIGIPPEKVFTPRTGECVDCTSERHIYQVKLKDSLVSSLKFSRAQDADLAWVDGLICFEDGDAEEGMEFQQEDGSGYRGGARVRDDDTVPVLDLPPSSSISGHNEVFINEPRLPDFKQVLTRNNIKAEFSGGVLICNSLVAVRRSEAGKISLEGALCEDFFTVRRLLYEQYAIV